MPLILETNVTPPIEIYNEAAREDSGGLGAWIRPRITGSLPLVGSVTAAPYGEPIPGLGRVVFVALIVLAAIGAMTVARRIV
ncbi:MAG TPA: hypothetical protein VGR44_12115 [Methylomirabilota bacterium]|jgi:hypothetical protein|nr:hypothetical protein [Methylomirabilota bacterium]